MPDRFHGLIVTRFPERDRLRALKAYERARREDKRAIEDATVLTELMSCLRAQEAGNGLVFGMTATLAAFSIMVLVHQVFIPYELSESLGFFAVMAVFGVWFALYKTAQRAIERRAVRRLAAQIAAIDRDDSPNDLK